MRKSWLTKKVCSNITEILSFKFVILAIVAVDANIVESCYNAVEVETHATEPVDEILVISVITIKKQISMWARHCISLDRVVLRSNCVALLVFFGLALLLPNGGIGCTPATFSNLLLRCTGKVDSPFPSHALKLLGLAQQHISNLCVLRVLGFWCAEKGL